MRKNLDVRFVYPDTEFISTMPGPAGTISIGVLDDAGRKFYAINRDVDLAVVAASPWLMANVVPHLPLWRTATGLAWDSGHPDYRYVLPPVQIAENLATYFSIGYSGAGSIRAFGWYGARDLVRIHDLYGDDWQMMPPQVPRRITELRDLLDQAGVDRPPSRAELLGAEATEHHALADTEYHRALHRLAMPAKSSHFSVLGDLITLRARGEGRGWVQASTKPPLVLAGAGDLQDGDRVILAAKTAGNLAEVLDQLTLEETTELPDLLRRAVALLDIWAG
ncbi:hypothetical protein [Nonomuraea sp. NPDC049400]|uniref:hypothetical protein n=1 Tax=Nonomuraea sp. NPDC049400 TaxID=3364352 RepID=UPI0037BD27D7